MEGSWLLDLIWDRNLLPQGLDSLLSSTEKWIARTFFRRLSTSVYQFKLIIQQDTIPKYNKLSAMEYLQQRHDLKSDLPQNHNNFAKLKKCWHRKWLVDIIVDDKSKTSWNNVLHSFSIMYCECLQKMCSKDMTTVIFDYASCVLLWLIGPKG